MLLIAGPRPDAAKLNRIARLADELRRSFQMGRNAELMNGRPHKTNQRIYKEKLWNLDSAINPARVPLDRFNADRTLADGWPAEVGAGLELLDRTFTSVLARWGLRWLSAAKYTDDLDYDGFRHEVNHVFEVELVDQFPTLRGRDEWAGIPSGRKVRLQDDDPWTFTDAELNSLADAVELIREGMRLVQDAPPARPDVEAEAGPVPSTMPDWGGPPSGAGGPGSAEPDAWTRVGRKRQPRRKRKEGKGERCLGIYTDYLDRNQIPPGPTEIAAEVGCSPGHACRAIKRLEERRRELSKEDARGRYRDDV